MRVKISIKDKDTRAYIRYLFGNDTEGDALRLSRQHPIGLLCCALVSYCDSIDNRVGDDIVTFILPCAVSTRSGHTKHCHFTIEDEGKIVDCISSMKKLDFHQHWVNGLTSGVRKKDIIESYILTRGLFDINADSQNKTAYRLQQRLLNSKIKNYYDKANVIDKKIKEEQLKYTKRYGI